MTGMPQSGRLLRPTDEVRAVFTHESEYHASESLSTELVDKPPRPDVIVPITWTRTLPPDLPPERLWAIILEYEALLDDWDQDCISTGYCRCVVAEAKALLADCGEAA